MLNFSESALQDADVLLYVTDMVETPDKNGDFLEKVSKMDVPVLLLINKIDVSNQQELTSKVEAACLFCPRPKSYLFQLCASST